MTIIVKFWMFTNLMRPELRAELGRKDPKALLLLTYWYTKIKSLGVWWFDRRIRPEGKAIYLFLQKNHKDNVDLQSLLKIPGRVFDL